MKINVTFIFHILPNTCEDDSYYLMDNPIHFLYPKRPLQAPKIKNNLQNTNPKENVQISCI